MGSDRRNRVRLGAGRLGAASLARRPKHPPARAGHAPGTHRGSNSPSPTFSSTVSAVTSTRQGSAGQRTMRRHAAVSNRQPVKCVTAGPSPPVEDGRGQPERRDSDTRLPARMLERTVCSQCLLRPLALPGGVFFGGFFPLGLPSTARRERPRAALRLVPAVGPPGRPDHSQGRRRSRIGCPRRSAGSVRGRWPRRGWPFPRRGVGVRVDPHGRRP